MRNGFWFLVSSFWLAGLPLFADIVELKSGQKVEGTILGFDGKKVSVRANIGGGTAELSQPLELIAKIQFIPVGEEARILTSPTGADIPALEALWKKREPFATLPGSDSYNVALRYGQALVAKQTKTAAKEALALCKRLDPVIPAALADAFRSLRLTALIASGDSEAAANEAAKMTDVSPENIGAFVESKYITAQAAAARIKALESDHPRWQEERDQVKERRRLYDEALDASLYPVVFQPDLTAKAARGLWLASELYLMNDDKTQAAHCAQEIISQFPDPEYLPRAQALLKKLGNPPAPTLPPFPTPLTSSPVQNQPSAAASTSQTPTPSKKSNRKNKAKETP